MIHADVSSPSVDVAVQKPGLVAVRMKGLFDGKQGVGVYWVESNRLADSWNVGRRQPDRPPSVRVLQVTWATAQLKGSQVPHLGASSQTSPVSLSRTAWLLNWDKTVKRK